MTLRRSSIIASGHHLRRMESATLANHKSTARSVHDIADRFWARVKVRKRGCWLWVGSRTNGYGNLSCRGISPYPLLAHRVAWELTHEPIPDGLHVLHTCDTPACCRPSHLFLGTQTDNNRDRQRKGRTACGDRNGARTVPERNPFVRNGGSGLRGEKHPQARLTDRAVASLVAEFAADPRRGKKAELARKYAITKTQVGRILTGRSRTKPKHAEEPDAEIEDDTAT